MLSKPTTQGIWEGFTEEVTFTQNVHIGVEVEVKRFKGQGQMGKRPRMENGGRTM